jgi:carboxypeptidase C (cathepsin A)
MAKTKRIHNKKNLNKSRKKHHSNENSFPDYSEKRLCLNAIIPESKPSSYTKEALEDEILSLPGLKGKLSSRQFSGYLNLPGTKKYIHYWFVECENKPKECPLVFWTNGGPGCSGLLGLLQEQGPYRPDKDLKLIKNKYAWTRAANVVFIEQPVGVGFSYSLDKKDYHINDREAAFDNLQTTLEFLKRFPNFSSSHIYLSGESYGGHYVPMWAKEIIEYNKLHCNKDKVNLKGFLVGNPFIDYYSGTGAEIETYWGHQLIPKPYWDQYKKHGCLKSEEKLHNQTCQNIVYKLEETVGKINPYAMDYPVCTSAQHTWLSEFMWSNKKRQKEHLRRTKKLKKEHNFPDKVRYFFNQIPSLKEYRPCIDRYSKAYLNQSSVKKALHVKESIYWTECTDKVHYSMHDQNLKIEKYFTSILDDKTIPDFRILVFSGDNDAICGTVGTQKWIWKLGYKVKSMWKPYYVQDQIGGYITHFGTPIDTSKKSRFTFATVSFAGHEVPTYRPVTAYYLFKAFLFNQYNFKKLEEESHKI